MTGLQENQAEEKKTGKSRKGQVYIFLICLCISAVIWLLIKLSRDYTTVRAYRIAYVNVPKDKLISGNPDSILFLTLRTNGYNLLLRKVFPRQEILNIDLGNLTLRKSQHAWDANLITEDLREKITSQISRHERLTAITPSVLYFRFDKSFAVKVPVIPHVRTGFDKQYGLYGKMLFNPDSVTVSGPAELVKSITAAYSDTVGFSKLQGSKYATVALSLSHNKLFRLSSNYIKLFIPVAEYTENLIELPVLSDSLSEGMQVKTYPEKVKVYYKVAAPDLKKVKAVDFVLGIETAKSRRQPQSKVRVNVIRQPAFVSISRIVPSRVEYIIIR
jgi:hypothetical protein